MLPAMRTWALLVLMLIAAPMARAAPSAEATAWFDGLDARVAASAASLGQKVREICAATGRSAASVSGLKFNAFVDLRRELDACGFVETCGAMFGLGEATS